MKKSTILGAVAAATLIGNYQLEKSAAQNASRPAAKRSTQEKDLANVEVILVNAGRGYAVAEILNSAKNHLKAKYPSFSLVNSNVTIWVDQAASSNSVKMFFGHGFNEPMVQMTVGVHGNLIEHSSFIAKEAP